MTRSAVGLLSCLAIAAPTQGQTVAFTKIADTSTPSPGGPNFATFGAFPSVDGSVAAFFGTPAGGTGAIYTGSGGAVSTLVPTTAPNPNGGNFTSLNLNFRYDTASAVFVGTGGTSSPGVYTSNGTAVKRFADAVTAIPGTGASGNFTSFSAFPSLSGATVAFTGSGSGGQQGIYTSTGGTTPAVTLVADKNTPVPGPTPVNFGTFGSNPSISGSTVAFRAGTGTQLTGIYTKTGAGPLTTVADLSTPLPNNPTNNFVTPFFEPTVSGTNVAFLGNNGAGNATGVYALIGGVLQTIVDNSTIAPNGSPFTAFGSYAPISGNTIAFLGNTATSRGVYLWDGALHTLVDNSTGTFDGRPLSTATPFFLGPDAIDGNNVVFSVAFQTGGNGIYMATFTPVPEPSTLVLCAGAGVGLICRRRICQQVSPADPSR